MSQNDVYSQVVGQAIFDLFDFVGNASSAPLAIGLLGLKVLASSQAYFERNNFENTGLELWSNLKHPTGSLRAEVQRSFEVLARDSGIEALDHLPLALKNAGEDRLARAISNLDQLHANIDDPHVLKSIAHTVDGAVNINAQEVTYPNPPQLNALIAELLIFESGKINSVYDPACGTGKSLTALHKQLVTTGTGAGTHYYGQDVNPKALFLAAWNLLLHGITRFTLAHGDMITAPQFLDGEKVRRFDLVVTTPPFNAVASSEFGAHDRYQRFLYGEVSGRRADYAFIQHALASIDAGGRGAVLVTSGAVSRSGFEEKIRSSIVRSGVLEACIGLPSGSFYTSLNSGVALIFNFDRASQRPEQIFFINLKRNLRRRMRGSSITPEAVDKIMTAFRNRQNTPGFSRIVNFEEIKSARYELDPAGYLDQERPKHKVLDLEIVKKKIADGESELIRVSGQFYEALTMLERDEF